MKFLIAIVIIEMLIIIIALTCWYIFFIREDVPKSIKKLEEKFIKFIKRREKK